MAVPVGVEQLEPGEGNGSPHILRLDCGARIRAQTVLIAAGIRWRKLPAENAGRFEGAGIYYLCTSVEALLYDNHDVAVVGAGNSAGQAAMFLSECCRDRTVHLVIRKRLGPGMSDYLVARIRGAKNIIVHEETEIEAVMGERRLEAMRLKKSGSDEKPTIACGAVFVFIGADPSCGFLPASIARDPLGYLLTGTDVVRSGKWPLKDRDPCPLETSVPGVLAAGDIRAGSTKRVGFAVGDGSLAVTCAHKLRGLRGIGGNSSNEYSNGESISE